MDEIHLTLFPSTNSSQAKKNMFTGYSNSFFNSAIYIHFSNEFHTIQF